MHNALEEEESRRDLGAILINQPPEVRQNPRVERAVAVLQSLSIEERLGQIKAINAGVVGKPYLHATGGGDARVFAYDEVAASLFNGFPQEIGALYIHFPYCTKKCRFCHYYKNHSAAAPEWEDFPQYIVGELGLLSTLFQFAKIRAKTIHYGGGSPSLLSPSAWQRFAQGVARYVAHDGDPEIAIEADPEDLSSPILRSWIESGVSRVSLGVQSFDADVLAYLRRGHNAKQAREAIELLVSAGVPNINVDLMYGMPKRSLGSWVNDLELIRIHRPHSVTCYATRPDPRNMLDKAQDFPSELERILAHQVAIEYMTDLGYLQYSPNQFIESYQGACLAKQYRNRCEDVLGVGPRAHSIFQGWFYENFASVDQYRQLVDQGKLCTIKGARIPPGEEKRRFLQFGLKLSGLNKPDDDNGVLVGEYAARFGNDITDELQQPLGIMTELGLVTHRPGQSVRLTHPGVLLSHEVGKYIGTAPIGC